MEDDAEYTQVSVSQRMVDKPCTTLRPDHNYSASGRTSGKVFNDPVHGHFRLDPVSRKIFDTQQFQRLGDLKQLGVTYFVFRGASHARLEHCMGVAHLAHTLADRIYSLQRGELDITRSDVKCAEVAGLVHDLGHGPYSHVFDRFMRRKGMPWEHEQMSVAILDDILAENVHNIDENDLSEDEIRHIKAMITAGKGGSPAPPGKRWLYEVVANDRNGLDVDKYDYLQRDAMYCNVKISAQIDRIFSFVKVLDDELCYKYSEYGNIHDVFFTRARMFRNVYLHKKASAVEHMVVDAFVEADPVLKLAAKTEDSREFARLDDTLLRVVENWSAGRPGFGGLVREPDEEGSKAMCAAKAIVARLRRRDLYKVVGEFLVPPNDLDAGRWEPPSAEDILGHVRNRGGARLRLEDIIVDEARVDLTRDNGNPMDNVSFFDFPESTTKKSIPADIYSGMMPMRNRERHCRVYSRDSSPRAVAALQDAFQAWIIARFGSRVAMSTPVRKPRPPPPGQVVAGMPNPRKRSLDGEFMRSLQQQSHPALAPHCP